MTYRAFCIPSSLMVMLPTFVYLSNVIISAGGGGASGGTCPVWWNTTYGETNVGYGYTGVPLE